jgi:hypothetical protein
MKRYTVLLLAIIVCGCTSRFEKDLTQVRGDAERIGRAAFERSVEVMTINVPPSYPESNGGWDLTFSNSLEYINWLLPKSRHNPTLIYANANENPFCVVLDLPESPTMKKSPAGRGLVVVREEALIDMPFLFTRNLKIEIHNGKRAYSVTTDWPFGKRGVAIYTYYGDHVFLEEHEVQPYFDRIAFDKKVLRP